MKKLFLLCLSLVAALGAVAEISVCDVNPDGNGHFDCPYIKSGSITWDEVSHTLTLDNATVDYSSETPYDWVYAVRITEDATIVIKGECKLITTGFIALCFEGTNSKTATIKGDGSLYLKSNMRGIYLRFVRLTIQNITLTSDKGIMNNGSGEFCALTFDNVKADINGVVERIGESITFQNCAITYPADAYIEQSEYGLYIANGNGSTADHIIISRSSEMVKGDVNGDGEVNIADVNAVIDVILGGSSNVRADVNNDGEINIADVNAVIDIIFGGGSSQSNHEYVNLGLPSGTLWATTNVGANNPEDFGDYFSWGETAPKEVYTWGTYKWCNGSMSTLTKYCTNSAYGTVDGKIELDPADDAAYVNWGPSWRMPTLEQCFELCEVCTWQWTTRNGVNGYLITGPNGNTLFMPAAGDRYNSTTGDAGCGLYWSRNVFTNIDNSCYAAFNLYFFSQFINGGNGNERYLGYTVRPVRVSQN